MSKLIMFLLLMALPFGFVQAQTTAFTYQGYIELNGSPVNDTCAFTFSLYDALTDGTQIGLPQTINSVIVTEGVFSVQLDFGANAFNGDDRWLDIAVNCDGTLTPLSPRQSITPAAYATFASTAGSIDWSNVGNVPSEIADGDDADTTYTAGTGLSLDTITYTFSVPANTFWQTDGNSGTVSDTHFIGTTDNVPFDIRANNERALRFIGNATSPNIIGGHSTNSVNPNGFGQTIGGGGYNNEENITYDNYAFIGGGANNRAGSNDGVTTGDMFSTVTGGFNNAVTEEFASVGGGQNNNAGGAWGAISGGQNNSIPSVARYAAIGGGQNNVIYDDSGVIGGGSDNVVGVTGSITDQAYATVSGGRSNTVTALYGTIGGGRGNIINGAYGVIGGGGGFGGENLVTDDYGTIAGGLNNEAGDGTADVANAMGATVGGGGSNKARGPFSTIGGGSANNANGLHSTVGGGSTNTATGSYSTVPGGYANTASLEYSFAAGYRAKANHAGAFVWADSTPSNFTSTADNQFNVRASGGVRFVTAIDGAGNPTFTCSLPANGAGGWACPSDRNSKDNFVDIDSREILEAVADMPISSWEFKGTDTRHIGPVAQDFYAAFRVGENDTTISMADADGVALAAIQGLNLKLQEEVSTLQQQMMVMMAVMLLMGISFMVLLFKKQAS